MRPAVYALLAAATVALAARAAADDPKATCKFVQDCIPQMIDDPNCYPRPVFGEDAYPQPVCAHPLL